jgi:Tol biopolymer transport system component
MVLGLDAQTVTTNTADSGPAQVVTINLRDGDETRLTNDLATYAGVSAVGEAIVTTRRQTNTALWVLDAAGHNARQIGQDFPSASSGLSWAGNTRVVYGATLAGGAGIWSTDVAGASDFVVPSGILPSASADGRTLVFFRGAGGGELWRADGDGRGPARITGGLYPQIAPDGSKLFYISGQSGTQAVWVVDLAGGQPRQFSTMPVLTVSEPAVSRDGRQVVFFSGDSAVVMPVDGGDPIRRIPMRATRLRWTHDGLGLTHADAAGANLWIQPIDGRAPRQLTAFPDDNKSISYFAWSPDGTQLAVARAITTSDVVLLKGVR